MAVSKKRRFEVFKRDGFICQYCGRSQPDVVLEVDHKQPKAAGGTDEMSNLVTSCYDCNRGKSAGLLPQAASLFAMTKDGNIYGRVLKELPNTWRIILYNMSALMICKDEGDPESDGYLLSGETADIAKADARTFVGGWCAYDAIGELALEEFHRAQNAAHNASK